MNYRYDPTDIDCEAFQYARVRADRYYNYNKKRYAGDRDDLYQIAMIAVVKAVSTLEDKTVIDEELLISAVEKVLAPAVKKFLKEENRAAACAKTWTKVSEESGDPYEHLVSERKAALSQESMEQLEKFKSKLETLLNKQQFDVLWQTLATGVSIEESVATIIEANKTKGKGNWRPASAAKLKRLLDEAIASVRRKLPVAYVDEIAKLPLERV